jgi:hypothetical protein
MKLRGKLGLAILAGAASLAVSAPAMAQNTAAAYGCACLHNNTQSQIKYRYKWGEGEWKSVTMKPAGGAQWMCWRYKDAPKSPDLTFELDVDLTSANKWKAFAIKRVQAKDTGCANIPANGHYHVGYLANSNKKEIRIFDGK